MENEKNTPKQELEEALEANNEILEEASKESQIHKRLHELDIILENFEDKLYNQETYTLDEEEYKAYKEESELLRKELKAIVKQSKKEGTLESLPLWIPLYGLLMAIFSIYPIVPKLPLFLVSYIYPKVTEVMITAFIFYALMIGYSLILLLISFFIWLYAFKNKANKKMFLYVFFMQIFIAVISCLIAYI